MEKWWIFLLFLNLNSFNGVSVISLPFGIGSSLSWSVLPHPYSLQWYLNLRQHKLPIVLPSPVQPGGYASHLRPVFKRPFHIFEDRLFPSVVKMDPISPAQNRLFPSHPVQDLMSFVGQPRLFPVLFGRELHSPLPNEPKVRESKVSQMENDTLAIFDLGDNSTVVLEDINDENQSQNDTEKLEVASEMRNSESGSVLLSRLKRSTDQGDLQSSRSLSSSSVVIFPSVQSASQPEKPQHNSDELRFSPSLTSVSEKVGSTSSTSSEHLDASGKLFMDGLPLFGGYYGRPHPFYHRPVLGSPDMPMSSLYSAASSSPSTSFLSSSPGSNSGSNSQQQQQHQHHLQSSNQLPQMLPPHHPSFLYPAMSAMYPTMLSHYPLAIGHHGFYPFPSPYQAVSVESLLVPLIGLVGLSLLVPDIIKTKREGRPSDIGGIDVFKRGSVNASSQDEDCLRRLACEAGVLFSEDDDIDAIQRALEKAITAKRMVPIHHVGDQYQSENKTICSHHVCASWMLDVNQLSSMSSIT